jgi:hypothetical protein
MSVAHQLATPDEHEADQLAGSFLGQAPVGAVCADRQDGTERVGRSIVRRDHALARGLADRDAQPSGAVGIAVETIGRQTPDLASPRPRPASDNHCCPLKRIRKRPDRSHEPIEIGPRDVARNAVGLTRQIAFCD